MPIQGNEYRHTEGTGEITCSTIVALWSRIASMIVKAALFRAALEDFEATVSG
jgi:hypothetical protein